MAMHIIQPRDRGLAEKVQLWHNELEAARTGANGYVPVDVSFKDFVEAKLSTDGSVSFDKYLQELGVEPNRMTIEHLITAPLGVNYLVPEIITDAIRAGIRKSPIHPYLIRESMTVEQPSVVMPTINFSGEPQMDPTAEAETIGYGTVSYTSKTVTVYKKAKGIDYTYESIRFSTIDMVRIFFEDLGVRLGYSLDNMLIDVLVNGDVAGGSQAISTIGVEATADGLTWYDMARIWMRGGRIGRSFGNIIGTEELALTIVNMDEYKLKTSTGQTELQINVFTPIVERPNLFAHGRVADGKAIFLDQQFAAVQLTAIPLMVESEAIVRRQLKGTVASIMTGFAKPFRDGSIQIDSAVTFAANPFPSYMNPDVYDDETE